MEELPLFHGHDEQFSAGGFLLNEQGVNSFDKPTCDKSGFTDDLQQLLYDWQTHVDGIQDSFNDSLDIEYNFDLKTETPGIDCPILSNALTTLPAIKQEPEVKLPTVDREKIVFPGDVEPLRVSSSIQTDSVLRRITQARSVLINGEREIFGKNIIGLHSLNELKTSPDEKCQITSTVINGKRYKIIIRPKSTSRIAQQAVKTEGSSSASLGDTKIEHTDELISELQNGDYDVPGNEDMLDLWQLPLGERADVDADIDVDGDTNTEPEVTPVPDPPRVPPLRIKIPKKLKKHKARKEAKARSNTREESVAQSIVEEGTETRLRSGAKRTSLLQAVPRRTDVKAGTRMQDAAIAMSRNKLLSIVSGGDSVQLDHDYCSYMLKKESPGSPSETRLRHSGSPPLKIQLMEKNPRKDSGLESGGVSDASEESHSPEHARGPPILAPQLASKLLEEQRRSKNHLHVTKMAAAFFRAANAITSGQRAADTDATNPASPDCDSSSPSLDSGESTLNDEPALEKPKKKLKLEEYRSRRSDKDKDQCLSPDSSSDPTESYINQSVTIDKAHIDTNESNCCAEEFPVVKKESLDEVRQEETVVKALEVPIVKEEVPAVDDSSLDVKKETIERREGVVVREREEGSRKRGYCRNRRSSSSSASGERSCRRKVSVGRRGRSGSREKRRSLWSPSRRSSSQGSSSSSGYSLPYRRSYRYRRRSRSRSESRSRSRSRNYLSRRRHGSNFNKHHSNTRRLSRSPIYSQREKQKQIEERRVIYVGRIAEGTTNNQLRQRFSAFGPILDISVHFREHGDNYGFVTFAFKEDAYQAVEHGNDDPSHPLYDLCFGGRRSFCKQRYSDLDGMPTSYSGFKDNVAARIRHNSFDFDLLLREAKDKLRMRKDKT